MASDSMYVVRGALYARAGRRPGHRKAGRSLLWLALLIACLQAGLARAELPVITLKVAGHEIVTEVASTDPARAQGLMHRRMLPENRGMLFVFPGVEQHGMWMMNTYLPLSVAFLDAEGIIINIEDMAPHTRDVHAAAKPAKYALEANRGWFAKRGIKPGTKVDGLGAAPPAR
jgi:uncharacterized membrane protein (UPF0127 family)